MPLLTDKRILRIVASYTIVLLDMQMLLYTDAQSPHRVMEGHIQRRQS